MELPFEINQYVNFYSFYEWLKNNNFKKDCLVIFEDKFTDSNSLIFLIKDYLINKTVDEDHEDLISIYNELVKLGIKEDLKIIYIN